MPEGVHRLQGVGVRSLEVGAIRKDGEEEALRYAVVEEGSNPCAWGGESFDEGEAGLGQGDRMSVMVLGIQRRGEPVPQPSDHPCGAEDEAI